MTVPFVHFHHSSTLNLCWCFVLFILNICLLVINFIIYLKLTFIPCLSLHPFLTKLESFIHLLLERKQDNQSRSVIVSHLQALNIKCFSSHAFQTWILYNSAELSLLTVLYCHIKNNLHYTQQSMLIKDLSCSQITRFKDVTLICLLDIGFHFSFGKNANTYIMNIREATAGTWDAWLIGLCCSFTDPLVQKLCKTKLLITLWLGRVLYLGVNFFN